MGICHGPYLRRFITTKSIPAPVLACDYNDEDLSTADNWQCIIALVVTGRDVGGMDSARAHAKRVFCMYELVRAYC